MKSDKSLNEMMKNNGDEKQVSNGHETMKNKNDEKSQVKNHAEDKSGAVTVNKVSVLKAAFERMKSNEIKTDKTNKTEVKVESREIKQSLTSNLNKVKRLNTEKPLPKLGSPKGGIRGVHPEGVGDGYAL